MYNPKSASGQIKAVLDLFQNPKRWIKGAFAQTKPGEDDHKLMDGNAISDLRKTPDACWCLVGGFQYIAGTTDQSDIVALPFVADAMKKEGFRTKNPYADPSAKIITFNDQKKRTIGEIRRVLRTALKLAQQAGA